MSPSKTWSGFFGGLFCVLVCQVVYFTLFCKPM
ncbi:MAG: phosphatidate cytidylyltransferase [Holosporaceae bacterium]|nr:MAG: phosphatidate cytidylyltransferase [Holosporaceae bacterium]